MHQRRQYAFRRGQRLGRGDHVVVWQRPQRPEWLTVAAYAAVPPELRVRALQVRLVAKGSRTKALVVATTLLEEAAFAAEDIADLYRQRWQAELDLRTLKQTLGMDQLRDTAPALVEREMWMYVLSYNLVRKVMAQAALWAKEQRRAQRGRRGQAAAERAWTPREFRFTGAVSQVMGWWHENTTGAASPTRYEALLLAVRRQRVGQRSGRCEPRAVKRRPKAYDRLMEPRATARARLLGELPPRDAPNKGRGGKNGSQSKPGAAGGSKEKPAGARGRRGKGGCGI